MSISHDVAAKNALKKAAQQACGQLPLRTASPNERIGLAQNCGEGGATGRRFLGKTALCELLLTHFYSHISRYSFAGSRGGFIGAAAPLARDFFGAVLHDRRRRTYFSQFYFKQIKQAFTYA
ncbi:hypothetical protein [Pseudomonas umsongensis]|jgi:hypothetical protein|uniref:hypothetical protein n=1 Tax=Pseudomonas umsongensis TaxID=198618 RepID=UPI0015BC687A|nr:hypothetical protein [Pseudomonas umsongensis]